MIIRCGIAIMCLAFGDYVMREQQNSSAVHWRTWVRINAVGLVVVPLIFSRMPGPNVIYDEVEWEEGPIRAKEKDKAPRGYAYSATSSSAQEDDSERNSHSDWHSPSIES